jgi:hypothetical protein
MSTKNNPGPFDCYANAHPEEPMFVLLGRDRYAGALVREWARARKSAANRTVMSSIKDMEQVNEAKLCADAMDSWCRKLSKEPARLAKPKWLVSAGGDQYQATLCYTDEEMENAYIEFQRGEVCEDRGDASEVQPEILFQREQRDYLRSVADWEQNFVATNSEDRRSTLTTEFEDGWISIHRIS